MLSTVEAWRREDVYITKAVRDVKEKILSKHCVCVIGIPGAGKSTSIHHAALSLESNGFIIYFISGLKEFLKFYDKSKKQVFVLDDALGIYFVDQGEISLWQKHNEKVRNALGVNTKLLVSIRTQIFMYETVSGKDILFLEKSSITDNVDFSDTDYKLGIVDMRGMLTYYLTKNRAEAESIDKIIKQIWYYTDKELTEMTEERRQQEMSRNTVGEEFSECFPLLCKVFVNNDFVKQNPEAFFRNPFAALTKVFKNIKSDNKHQFCALVLCTMLNGELTNDTLSSLSEHPLLESEHILDRQKENLCNYIMSTYKLKCPEHLEDLQSALNSLTGVYILHIGDTYRMAHAVFHDIVTYLYNDPLLVFKYGTREFIRDRVRINTTPLDDPYILVYNNDTNIQRLRDRLISDLIDNTRTGARFIVRNPNIGDVRLFSYLRQKLFDQELTNNKELIDWLFRECIDTVWYNRDTYKGGDVTQYNLIELCIQLDCNMDVGLYPLHACVSTGSVTLYKLIIQHTDTRRADFGDSVLHCVCMYTKYNKLEIIKLLLQQHGDRPVVRLITSNRDRILQTVDPDRHHRMYSEYCDSELQLEEVLCDKSIKVLTTDRHNMKRCVEHYTGTGRLQLVERLHDNILTYVDDCGRNVLHYSADDISTTQYFIDLLPLTDINKPDRDGRTPYWFVVNKIHPVMGEVEVDEKDRDMMMKLYNNKGIFA